MLCVKVLCANATLRKEHLPDIDFHPSLLFSSNCQLSIFSNPLIHQTSLQTNSKRSATSVMSSIGIHPNNEDLEQSPDAVVGNAASQDSITTPPDRTTTSPTFRFTDLPPEIRITVDSILIASGDLSIADTNQLMRQEATPLIHEDGFFKITITRASPALAGFLYLEIDMPSKSQVNSSSSQIQTSRSQWTSPNRTSQLVLGHMTSNKSFFFTDAMVKKTNCILTLQNFDPCIHRDVLQKMTESLKPLNSFEHIYVTALAGCLAGASWITGFGTDREPYPRVTKAQNRSVYELVKEEWELTFGPAIWHDSVRQTDRYLAFHPRR